MRIFKALSIVIIFFSFQPTFAQHQVYFDLLDVKNLNTWTVHNREFNFEQGQVYLDGKPGDGLLYCNGFDFSDGKIEVDIKGKDVRGQSFVGMAFHGLNDSTYDVIYFRPFNFKSPERSNHSVQYISHPQNTWHKLRNEFPEKYENSVVPVPDPSDWFHATIEIQAQTIKVYVNNSEEPTLVVTQLSSIKGGWLGFWVGNNSEGHFKNLRVISK